MVHVEVVVTRHKIATEFWNWNRKLDIKLWLVKNFGVNGGRWGESLDHNFWMHEDVYIMYKLRWE